MTGTEWLVSGDPEAMQTFLRGRGSERKWRLFAVACCRRVSHAIIGVCGRAAVLAAERLADGLVHEAEASAAGREALHASMGFADVGALAAALAAETRVPAAQAALASARAAAGCAAGYVGRLLAFSAASTAWNIALAEAEGRSDKAAWWRNCEALGRAVVADYAPTLERAGQAALLRDLFGNPFRPAAVDADWLAWEGGVVCHLARSVYEERAFDRLPVLADALEEAGCDDQDLLTHCRSGGQHATGCWAVDLLLGKG